MFYSLFPKTDWDELSKKQKKGILSEYINKKTGGIFAGLGRAIGGLGKGIGKGVSGFMGGIAKALPYAAAFPVVMLALGAGIGAFIGAIALVGSGALWVV
jgi:hypothetical protein